MLESLHRRDGIYKRLYIVLPRNLSMIGLHLHALVTESFGIHPAKTPNAGLDESTLFGAE